MSFLMLRVRVPKARAAFMISDPESSVQRWHLPVSLSLWRSSWNLGPISRQIKIKIKQNSQ